MTLPPIELEKPTSVLVTDFDGTMTRYDFYHLAIEQLIPKDCPNYWQEYLQGRMTHFEALQAYFLLIRSSEPEVLAMVNRMQLDPQLPSALASLRATGWQVVVASAGCDWYIKYLLAQASVSLEVYANPGVFLPGQGLQMSLPANDRFLSPTIGVDKAGVVRHWLDQGCRVAFAGDGFPDAEAARLVTPELRFAKADLAKQLQQEQLKFQPFSVWSDIPRQLLKSS
jgi:2,3-diketo-5-methylthio-1-phosphopentane phosphatase